MSLKILFVINGLGTGGAERSLAEMLPKLLEAEVEPTIVCFYRRAEGVEGYIQSRVPKIHFLTGKGLIGRVRAIRKIVTAERPDLIHATLFEANLASRLAAIGKPVAVLSSLVSTSYDPIRLYDPNLNSLKLWGVKIIDGWTARNLSHHFHAISHTVKTTAVEALSISPEHVTVIERGRGSDRLGYFCMERRHQIRRQLGLSDDDEVIVNVGRQEYPKGQRHLLEAMEQLQRSHNRIVLLIVGRRGNASRELEELQQQMDLNGRVRFLGHRDDVPDILAAADLFVFPSLYEGLGGALIEAMALERPIVASNIPVMREVVEEGGNALLAEPANPQQLASAIEELLNDREKAMAFGRRGRQIFEERFTLERSTTRMIELYRKLSALSNKVNLSKV